MSIIFLLGDQRRDQWQQSSTRRRWFRSYTRVYRDWQRDSRGDSWLPKSRGRHHHGRVCLLKVNTINARDVWWYCTPHRVVCQYLEQCESIYVQPNDHFPGDSGAQTVLLFFSSDARRVIRKRLSSSSGDE